MASWIKGWFQDRERKSKDKPGPSYGVKKVRNAQKMIQIYWNDTGSKWPIWDNFSNKIMIVIE